MDSDLPSEALAGQELRAARDSAQPGATDEASAEGRDRFRTVADFTYDWEYWARPDGALLYVSPSCERITGYRPEEFQQNPELLEEITHPDDRALVAGHLRAEAEQEGILSADFRIVTRSNEERWIAHVCQRVPGSDGTCLGRRASNRDETDRKRAERALAQSESRCRAVVEDQTELICRFLPDGTITFVNGAYCRYFGRSAEDLVGRSFLPLIPAEDRERARSHLASLGPSNPVSTQEHRVVAANGGIRWQQWTNRALCDDEGRVVEFQAVGRDITDRKWLEAELENARDDLRRQVEERTAELRVANERLAQDVEDCRTLQRALQESEQRYRLLVETMTEGLAVVDQNAVVTYANARFLRMIGCGRDEAVGRPVSDFFDAENRKKLKGEFAKRRSGSRGSYEIVCMGKDGREVSTLLSPEPLFDAEGEFKGSLAVITDISALKRTEQSLRERERELERRTRDLEEANTALKVLLKQREKDRAEFEDSVHFNVRELIEPYLDKLKASRLSGQQEAHLNLLSSNLRDMLSSFPQRLSSRGATLTPTEIQVANLVQQGRTSKEMARLLNLSRRTIEFHRDNIRKKLGIKNKKTNLRSLLLSTP